MYEFAPKSQDIYPLKAPRRCGAGRAYRQSQLMQLCQIKLRQTKCSMSILCSFSVECGLTSCRLRHAGACRQGCPPLCSSAHHCSQQHGCRQRPSPRHAADECCEFRLNKVEIPSHYSRPQPSREPCTRM